MGLYSFDKRFVPKVISGEKTHTIRAVRKYPDKPGSTLTLVYGSRYASTLIFRAECVKVETIEIEDLPAIFLDAAGPVIRIAGEALQSDEVEALARRDGFKDFAEMMDYWDGKLPFTGHIIHWKYPNPVRRTL